MQLPGVIQPAPRNRVGSFFGTLAIALMAAGFLLGSADLSDFIGRQVSKLLDAAEVPHELVLEEDATGSSIIGARGRSEVARPADGALIRVGEPRVAGQPQPQTREPLAGVAIIFFAVAAAAAVTTAAPQLRIVAGTIAAVGIFWGLTYLHQGTVGPLPPLDATGVVIDARISPLLPMAASGGLFAYMTYPAPGSLVSLAIKFLFTGLIAAFVGLCSIVRIALFAAALQEFGPGGLLPAFIFAGTHLDLIFGVAATCVAIALVTTGRKEVRSLVRPMRMLFRVRP